MSHTSKKILKNKFKWTPKHLRLDKLGLPVPPRPTDNRIPRIWITSLPPVEKNVIRGKDLVRDTYLVNSSGVILESVIASTGGIQYWDEDSNESVSGKDKEIEYNNVEHGDAVRVFEHEAQYDADWFLAISIKVKMNGKWINLSSSVTKGLKGFGEEVLLY